MSTVPEVCGLAHDGFANCCVGVFYYLCPEGAQNCNETTVERRGQSLFWESYQERPYRCHCGKLDKNFAPVGEPVVSGACFAVAPNACAVSNTICTGDAPGCPCE